MQIPRGAGIPHRQAGVRNLREVAGILATAGERLVFNLVEGFAENPADAMMVPSLCRAWRRGWTGNDTAPQLLTLDKWQTKAALRQNGLPTPQALIIEQGSKIRGELFPGPYIVKPLRADASEGIDSRSVVAAKDERLYDAVQRIHEQFDDSAMIEQYIDGRELNVSVLWKDNDATVLPLAEIDFSAFDASRVKIVGYEAKWRQDSFEYQNTPRVIPAPLPEQVAQQVRELSISACRAVGCDDYCRVDFRLDDQLRPYILEVNANPDISPDAGFAAALQAAGIAFSQFVASCIDRAHDRLRNHSIPPTPINEKFDGHDDPLCSFGRSGADDRHAGGHELFLSGRGGSRPRGPGRIHRPRAHGALSVAGPRRKRPHPGLDLFWTHTLYAGDF